jgi:hypothetical protein
MMAARGQKFAWRAVSRALPLAISLVPALLFFVQAANAKDRDYRNYNNGYSQKAMAEWERQRKEQEKALQAAIKAMQEAQKAAMREAQKAQNQAARQQMQSIKQPSYQQPTYQQQTPSKTPASVQKDNKSATDNDKTTNADRNKTADRSRDDAVNLDDADSDDVFLSDRERQLRAIGRERQRALEQVAREQQMLQEREAARAARIRERSFKHPVHSPDRKPEPSPVAQPGTVKVLPGTVKAPPQTLPVAVEKDSQGAPGGKDNPGQKPFAERGSKWLEAYERKASGLGMGREAVKAAIEQAKRDGKDDGAKDGVPLPSASDKDTTPGKPAKGGDTKTAGSDRMPGLRGKFPGKDLGAELPVEMFEAERATELIATGISAVDQAKAEAHGFIVSPPVELKGLGKTVQRIRAPAGANRDEAERELHKILPFLSVTPNQAHNIFVGSLGEKDRSAGVTPPGQPGADRRGVSPASSQPCPHNTCFGGELIKWKSTLGSCAKGVRIGIIDTSFDVGHPALEHITVEQGEFLDGKPASPYDWHGTAVLSLLAGDPRSGTPGLVPDATFLLATAFRSDAAGNASTDTVRLIAALAWLEGLDVDIVNMSFSGPRDEAVSRAIARMSEKGIVFIAAAGNGGPIAGPSYPAAYPSVIAVTAVNRNGENYRNANRGTYIDVAAPGVDILTALPDAKQGYRTGTSFAAPFVTAIVATRGAELGGATAKAQLLQQVSTRDLGPPGRDPIYGAGLALAPARCQGGAGAIAKAAPVPNTSPVPAAASIEAAPEIDSWSSQTTLIKAGTAGAAFAP